MRLLFLFFVLFLCFSFGLNAQSTKPPTDSLLGTWVIDLRPTPESEPYLKEFKFTRISGKKFDGEFYGYPFKEGFLNTDWGKIWFAFTTSDQSGTYFHSGYIEGNKIQGLSFNQNRKLTLPWKGSKK
ncbi:MAG: hypothetical protein KAZ11_02530 [Chitinophagaceae bacterium]|nr:hypothetical protein [Chitinophagaceae bacterium]